MINEHLFNSTYNFIELFGCAQILLQFNKGRFCNTIASVALVHTSIQSDKRNSLKQKLKANEAAKLP